MNNLLRNIYTRFIFLGLTLISLNLYAGIEDEGSSKDFGQYTVHYSTFNSLFISADTAQAHQLIRAKDLALINIAVQKTQGGTPVNAKISCTAKNLMQQNKNIEFKTITEPGAIYYLGAIKHSNEEVFHLNFSILPEGESQPLEFRLTRKFYTEP
jgi:hypothetical protein